MVWCRSCISLASRQHCAYRLRQSYEAAFWMRCFSRTPTPSTQHDEDRGSKRSSSISNPKWAHIQHCRRWQKRFTEDPYNAIFGASNNMLAGKSIKDWDWISRGFPKWMIRDMEDLKDYVTEPKCRSYKERLTAKSETMSCEKERSHFPQPCIRTTRFDRDNVAGIASPSDSRRPREQSHAKPDEDPVLNESAFTRGQKAAVLFYGQRAALPSNKSRTVTEASQSTPAEIMYPGSSKTQDAAAQPSFQDTHTKVPSKDTDRQQIVLQRRAGEKPALLHDSNTVRPTTSSQKALNTNTSTTEKFSAASAYSKPQDFPDQLSKFIHNNDGPMDQKRRAITEKLALLPENDVDFISAAEIRATMRARKRTFMSDEDRGMKRKKLEQAFQEARSPDNIHPMIEAKTASNQMIRRLERDFRKSTDQILRAIPSMETEDTPTVETMETPVGSSIRRLRNWIERSSAVLTNNFWQDPTEEAGEMKTRVFFDKVASRIRKGRVAMGQVIKDLESDIPASKPLLKRMRQDESLLDSAIQALSVRPGDRKDQGLLTKSLYVIQTPRLIFEETDRELETAYASLKETSTVDAILTVSLSFKRQLALASTITHKNAQLTRYLIWSLETHFGDRKLNWHELVNYKTVANSLLALRDTQTALVRLVDRVMSIYGVEAPKVVDDLDILLKKLDSGVTHESSPSFLQGPVTAEKLDSVKNSSKAADDESGRNKIITQGIAMSGRLDNDNARTSKSMPKILLEERNLLAHSLFRPFSPVLAGLSNGISTEASETHEKEVKKRSQDAKPVEEMKDQNTYNPTLGETQPLQASGDRVGEFGLSGKVSLSKSDLFSSVDTSETPETMSPPSASGLEDQSIQLADAPVTVGTKEVHRPTSTPLTNGVSVEASIERDVLSANSASDPSAQPQEILNLPTHYTILIYNPQKDSVSVNRSTSPPPRDTTPAMPLPLALSALDAPAKFLPHLTEALEIVSAKSHMLVLRDYQSKVDAMSSSASYRPRKLERKDINPIDGTVRLSPTGYTGPEESAEQLEREFEGRRHAARQMNYHGFKGNSEDPAKEDIPGKRKEGTKGGAGSVIKTAIWAAATCYVFGVIGELVSGP